MGHLPSPTPAAICPRCGYDQSGIIATWHSACPLRGLCSECGLDFEWRLVLGPEVLGPPWSIEHGARLSLPRAAAAIRRGVSQAGLWREFELAYSIRRARLVLLLVGSLLANHLLLAAILAAGLAIVRVTRGWVASTALSPEIWLWPYDETLLWPIGGRRSLDLDLAPIVIQLYLPLVIPPLLLLVFVETMSRVGVRQAHLLRGAAYMAPCLPPASLGLIAGWVLLGWLSTTTLAATPLVLAPLGIALALGWPLLQTLRWRAFIAHYLRLPHATWIATSAFVILMLSIVLASLALFILSAG